MKVEIFYFEGCPNHKPALERVRAVIRGEGLSAEVNEIEVPDEAAAKKFAFPGSPTVRVNGDGIDPGLRGSNSGSLACRCYPGGIPPAEMIKAALDEARRKQE